MKVRDVMQIQVISVPDTATYEDVAKLLHVYNISGLPVVNADKILVGVVSEKDLFRILYPRYDEFYRNPEAYLDLELRETKVSELRGRPVVEFMSRDIVTVAPDDLIMKAGSIMLAKNVHRMPVLEGGQLKGIISRRDIFKNILQKNLSFGEKET